MAVTLHPHPNLKKVFLRAFRDSGLLLESVARELGTTTSVVESYLQLEILPDPATYLNLRRVLKINSDNPMGADFWYLKLLADQKPQSRRSNIKKRHAAATPAPDPLEANSAEELVQKLRDLRRWALMPSLRELEKRSGGGLKRSTIHDLLHTDNKTLPRFDRYVRFLDACGVRESDVHYWVSAWRKVSPRSQSRPVQVVEEAMYETFLVSRSVNNRNDLLNAS